MKNKDVINHMIKDAKKQITGYVNMINNPKFKTVPRDIKFSNNINKNLYNSTKELVIASNKQYYIAHKILQDAKRKNIVLNDRYIIELDKLYTVIKTKILPKFKNDINYFASYIAYEKILTASLHKGALNQTYELTLKQLEIVKKANKELTTAIKKAQPELKLEETTDALTEADIKEILKAPFKLLKNAFIGSLKILVEGWLYVLKSAKQIVLPIKKKIDEIFRKFDGVIGKAAKNVIQSINPDFIKTLSQFDITDEDELEWTIGSYIRKAAIYIIGSFTFGAGAFVLLETSRSVLQKIITAGEYGELGTLLIDLVKASDMSDMEDDLKNL